MLLQELGDTFVLTIDDFLRARIGLLTQEALHGAFVLHDMLIALEELVRFEGAEYRGDLS